MGHQPRALRRSTSLYLTAALCVAVAASALAWKGLAATPTIGCGAVAPDSIAESVAFTPYGSRLTQRPEHPINAAQTATGVRPAFAPSDLGGLPAAFSRGGGSETETFYFGGAIDSKMTYPQFFAAGGILFLSYPGDPAAGSYADLIQLELGSRATIVQVGQVDAVLTWGDPLSNGVRVHDLSWYADGTIYKMMGERPPEVIVGLARGAVC